MPRLQRAGRLLRTERERMSSAEKCEGAARPRAQAGTTRPSDLKVQRDGAESLAQLSCLASRRIGMCPARAATAVRAAANGQEEELCDESAASYSGPGRAGLQRAARARAAAAVIARRTLAPLLAARRPTTAAAEAQVERMHRSVTSTPCRGWLVPAAQNLQRYEHWETDKKSIFSAAPARRGKF